MPHAFEELLLIDEPHLIDRYSRALQSFGKEAVTLDAFSVDMTGYSPEVAAQLGDQNYLDPADANRRFIILSPEQAFLPVVKSSFSNTQDLMSDFFEHNRRILYALTIKDVVFGEIEDNVFIIDDIDDLLAIEQVTFKIGTHEKLTEKSNKLKRMIDRLRKEPDAWRDDEMLEEMVSIVKQTGDIRDNELVPEEVVFRHRNFWSAHFGGTYIFNDDRQITVICDPSAPGFRKSRPWEVGYLDLENREAVFDFLWSTDRIEAPNAEWVAKSRLLEFRKHMAAIALAAGQKDEMPHSLINQTWVRRWARENRSLVREDNTLPLIDWVEEQLEFRDEIRLEDVDPDDRFVLCRANPEHEDMALVNRLISEYLPFDFLTRYEFNRPNFVRDRAKWDKAYGDFVANTIQNTYLNDRSRLYDNLYR